MLLGGGAGVFVSVSDYFASKDLGITANLRSVQFAVTMFSRAIINNNKMCIARTDNPFKYKYYCAYYL